MKKHTDMFGSIRIDHIAATRLPSDLMRHFEQWAIEAEAEGAHGHIVDFTGVTTANAAATAAIVEFFSTRAAPAPRLCAGLPAAALRRIDRANLGGVLCAYGTVDEALRSPDGRTALVSATRCVLFLDRDFPTEATDPVTGRNLLNTIVERIAQEGVCDVTLAGQGDLDWARTILGSGQTRRLRLRYCSRVESPLGALRKVYSDWDVPDAPVLLIDAATPGACSVSDILFKHHESHRGLPAAHKQGAPAQIGSHAATTRTTGRDDEDWTITGRSLPVHGMSVVGEGFLKDLVNGFGTHTRGTTGPGHCCGITRSSETTALWDLSTEIGRREFFLGTLSDRLAQYGDGAIHGIRVGNEAEISWTAKLHGPVFIGAGARIERWADIRGPAIIGEGATIGKSAIVEGAIIGRSETVPEGARVSGGTATETPSEANGGAITEWDADRRRDAPKTALRASAV